MSPSSLAREPVVGSAVEVRAGANNRVANLCSEPPQAGTSTFWPPPDFVEAGAHSTHSFKVGVHRRSIACSGKRRKAIPRVTLIWRRVLIWRAMSFSLALRAEQVAPIDTGFSGGLTARVFEGKGWYRNPEISINLPPTERKAL